MAPRILSRPKRTLWWTVRVGVVLLLIGTITAATQPAGVALAAGSPEPLDNPITPALNAGNNAVMQGSDYFSVGLAPDTSLASPSQQANTAFIEEANTLGSLDHPLWISPILTTGGSYNNLWAPTLKYLLDSDGQYHWYVYESGTVTSGTNSARGIFILRSNTSSASGAWENLGYISGTQTQCAYDPGILQMPNGALYLSEAVSPTDTCNTYPSELTIQQLSNPETITGSQAIIAYPGKDHPTDPSDDPALNWEHVCGSNDYAINEAPDFLVDGSTVDLVYDANKWTTSCYVWGLVTASTSANLTNPSSWTKDTSPVWQGAGTVLNVGNHEFLTSPDGSQHWVVYNTLDLSGQSLEHMNAQQFSLNSNGTPNFGTPIGVGVDQTAPSGEPDASNWHTTQLWYNAVDAVQHGTNVPSLRAGSFSVEQVGGLSNSGAYLQWNHVYVPIAGTYPMLIQYSNELAWYGLDDTQSVTINGSKTYVTLPRDSSYDNILWTTAWVTLQAGDNVVTFGSNLGSEINGFQIPWQEAELSLQTGGATNIARGTASQGYAVSLPVAGCAELDYKLLGMIGGGGYSMAFLYSTPSAATVTVSYNNNTGSGWTTPTNVALASTGTYDQEQVASVNIGLTSEGMTSVRFCGASGSPQVDALSWS